MRLLTDKPISVSLSSSASASEVAKQIAMVERKYQEDLNKAFGSLSEGAFKALRRQLPITRQKIEWEKISGYRVSTTWSTSIVGDITKDVAAGTGHWWREVEIKKIGEL